MKFGVKTAIEMELLSIVKEVGFRQVEIYTSKKMLNDSSVDILKRFDFEYILHSPVDYFDDTVIDFAIRIGSKIIVIHYNPETTKDFKKLIRRARNYGIQLCVENAPDRTNTLYRTPVAPEEFLKLKEEFPEIKLCLDVEHAMQSKLFPRMIKVLGKENIGYVHVTGYPPTPHSPPFLNRSMFEIELRELKSVGYDGIVTAEMDVQYQVEEIFRKLKEFLKEFS